MWAYLLSSVGMDGDSLSRPKWRMDIPGTFRSCREEDEPLSAALELNSCWG